MQKSEYRQAAGISQSAFKKFRHMPLIKFKEMFIDRVSFEEISSDSLTFGSLVDTQAFEPHLIDERFYILPYHIDYPGDKLKLVVDTAYKQIKETIDTKVLLNIQGNLPEEIYIPDIYEMQEYKEIFLKVAKELKYGGGKWTNNTIFEHIWGTRNYYNILVEANGRDVITFVESADGNQMVNNLRSDPNTTAYFVQQDGEILLFQQEIYEDYDYEDIKVPLKCAVDIIRIVPKTKQIFLPDLKTIYDVREFRDHAVKYRYLDQVSFYRFMVRKWLQRYKGGLYKDYTIMTPFDIVIDAIVKVPYIFEFDEADLEIVEYGSKEKGIEGWRNTLNEIGWHIKNDVWNMPKELFENGKIKLKFFHD